MLFRCVKQGSCRYKKTPMIFIGAFSVVPLGFEQNSYLCCKSIDCVVVFLIVHHFVLIHFDDV
jgi:hypothetical protein